MTSGKGQQQRVELIHLPSALLTCPHETHCYSSTQLPLADSSPPSSSSASSSRPSSTQHSGTDALPATARRTPCVSPPAPPHHHRLDPRHSTPSASLSANPLLDVEVTRKRMSHVDIGRYSKRIVQAFWDPEPKNEDSSPVWCLGRSYDASAPAPATDSVQPAPPAQHDHAAQGEEGESAHSTSSFEYIPLPHMANSSIAARSWPPDFLDDFEAKIWLTYRSAFTPIPRSQDPKASSSMSLSVRLKSQFADKEGFTSDTGWGCMIRSGQSLLANAILFHHLGRDWRRSQDPDAEKKILQWFADDPRAPFSIHKFVEHGAAACGTFPGQWFGPSATSQCIEALVRTYEVAGLKVYVTGDGPDVYEKTLLDIAKPGGQPFQPVLLLVGTRLGIDRITPVYWEALKESLRMPQSVGIAGGRPASSHYFVGNQGSSFFYLDPHQPRPALPYHEDAAEYTADETDSCHTRRLRKITIEEMDPSMLIAFLFQDEADWISWRRTVSEAPGKAIFHVSDSPPTDLGYSNERHAAVDEVEAFDDEDEGLDTK